MNLRFEEACSENNQDKHYFYFLINKKRDQEMNNSR
jgi:hypothetical protein